MRGIAFTLVCALIFGACAGQGGGGAQAHPGGWRVQSAGKNVAWVDPGDRRQQFMVASSPSSVSLADLGAKITIDTLLRHKGAKLVRALVYPACPGEAGLQSFTERTATEFRVLRVAYSTWSGSAIVATYLRPASAADDPAAVRALTAAVCSAVSGTPTLPPVGR